MMCMMVGAMMTIREVMMSRFKKMRYKIVGMCMMMSAMVRCMKK